MAAVVTIPADPSGWHGALAVVGAVGFACIALAALYFLVSEIRRGR